MEQRKRGTSNASLSKKMRDRKGEENKTTVDENITTIPPNVQRQAKWKCPHTGPQVIAAEWNTNDCHYQPLDCLTP